MRIAVADVLGWLAEGMTVGDILAEFPELTEADIRAALAFAADRERRTVCGYSVPPSILICPASILSAVTMDILSHLSNLTSHDIC
jgi:hypothetical protein